MEHLIRLPVAGVALEVLLALDGVARAGEFLVPDERVHAVAAREG